VSKLTALAALALIVVAAAWAADSGAPSPSPFPVAWQLDFTFQTPQTITVDLPGRKGPQTFWYMLYSVTNRSGGERSFQPSFLLYTEDGKPMKAGDGVPLAVFASIQKRHNNPLLLDYSGIVGKLLQGEDNAKEGVAMWAQLPAETHNFDIFVAGLSGERKPVDLPVPIVDSQPARSGSQPATSTAPTKTRAVLSKTLQLTYSLPGDPAADPPAAPKLIEQKWVMR
jgi:hypothetical protein